MPTSTMSAGDWNPKLQPHDSGYRWEDSFPDKRVNELQEEVEKFRKVLQALQEQRDAAREECREATASDEDKKSEIVTLRNGMIKMLRLSGIMINIKKLDREVVDWRKHVRYLCETLINRANWLNMEKYLTSDKAIDRFIGSVMWENSKAKLVPEAPAP